MNKTIVRMQFGSHVYGTNLPTSDRDYKSIFIPDGLDLILQQPAKHIQNNTKKDKFARNSAEDIDDEAFSIQTFIRLLMEGQTVSLDMLFTPEKWYEQVTPEWWWLQASAKVHLLHSGTTSFVGYTKTQAAKYGLKGGRIDALESTLTFLNSFQEWEKLKDHAEKVHEFVNGYKPPDDGKECMIQIADIRSPTGLSEPHLQCANRKVPFAATVKYAKEIFQKILDNYGARARLAQQNLGVDWKAIMHAVRVSHEAYELLTTGKITFPRPEVDLLLKIRKGELGIKECETIIEDMLYKVESAKEASLLPKEPDRNMATEVVRQYHSKAIRDTLAL